MPAPLRFVSPISSRSRDASAGSYWAYLLRSSGENSALSSRIGVVAFPAEAEEKRVVQRPAIDAERQGAAEAHVAVQRPPHRVGGVEVGVKRELAAAGVEPEQGPVALGALALLEDRDVAHREPAGQEVGLAGVRLRGHEAAGRDVEDHAVDIGQLLTGRVDAVVVGVALEGEAGRRGGIHHPPALQGRQVRIGVLEHVVHAVVQRRPGLELLLLRGFLELSLVGVFRVELLQVVGRPVQEGVARPGELRQEARVRLVPAVSDRALVEDLEARRLAVQHHELGDAGRRDLGVVRHVLPVVAEVVGRERMAVRPAMAVAEAEGEDLVVLVLELCQKVGLERELFRVADEPGVGLDRHVADVPPAGDEATSPRRRACRCCGPWRRGRRPAAPSAAAARPAAARPCRRVRRRAAFRRSSARAPADRRGGARPRAARRAAKRPIIDFLVAITPPP